MALSSAQGESGQLGPMDDAGAPHERPMDAQPTSGGSQAAAEGSAAFKILSQPAEGQVMDNGDGTFSFDTGGDFQDLAIGEARQVSFTFLLERSEVVTATVVVTATPEGPVAKDVSYVSDGDSAPPPAAVEPTPVAMAAPADPAPFDAAPLSDLGSMAFDDPAVPEPQAEAPELILEPDSKPDSAASFLTESDEAPEQDHSGFGSEPMTPLADLDFATAPAAPAAASEPETPLNMGGQEQDVPSEMIATLKEPAPEPASGPVTEALPPEGGIDILTQPGAGSVSNNGDGTFTFDPGDAFQDLADGETRDVRFTLRLADGAVMTAVVTVAGDPAGPIAHDVTFLAEDDTTPEAEQTFDAPAFDAPAFDAPSFDAPTFEAPPADEPGFAAPVDETAARSAFAADSSPIDPWDRTPAAAAKPEAPSETGPTFEASKDVASEPAAAPAEMASDFQAPAPSWEPEAQEPAFDAARDTAADTTDDFFGGGSDMPTSQDSSDQDPPASDVSTPADVIMEPEPSLSSFEPTPEREREPLPERQAAMDMAPSEGSDSGFSSFSDFESAPTESPVAAEESMDWAAEPTQDEEPAMPAASPADSAPSSAFGDFDSSFGAEPAPMEAASPEPAAEPALAAPASTNEDDFAGMDGARRVDTLQLSGVTAGPGIGGWNVELSNGRIVDIQDGCVLLAAGSSGTLVLDDSNVRVSFDGIERIVW